MKTQNLLGALVCLITLFLCSCAAIKGNDPAARLAVNIGTMKAIEAVAPEKRLERADRIIELCTVATSMLSDESVALGLVYERVSSEINWADLPPSDVLLYRTLLATLAQKVRERIDQQTLDGDKVTTVKTAISWVEQSASDYKVMIQ